MKKPLILAFSALAVSTALIAAPAQARVNWSVNLGLGGFGYYPPPVVYAAPRPYYPPPVVYSPAPVYPVAQPVVEYGAPVVVYGYPDRHWQGPRYDRYPNYHGGYQRGYREYRDYRR